MLAVKKIPIGKEIPKQLGFRVVFAGYFAFLAVANCPLSSLRMFSIGEAVLAKKKNPPKPDALIGFGLQ